MTFETVDSGKREQYDSGMQRDTQDDKPRYDLIDRPFLRRWADLMARGAKKYGEENWRKATGEAEFKRFQASALRHLIQWLDGDMVEDHAAAVAFNLAGAEMVRLKLNVQGTNGKGTVDSAHGVDLRDCNPPHSVSGATCCDGCCSGH